LAGNSFDHYSKKARSAINRFYEHADTRTLTALQELVSDLALAEPGAADKLWSKAGTLLAKAKAPEGEAARILGARDVKQFAALVARIIGGKSSA
jgi:hypothetical protein